jgi:hypothetical protein
MCPELLVNPFIRKTININSRITIDRLSNP